MRDRWTKWTKWLHKSSNTDPGDQIDDETPQRDSLLLVLAIGVGVLLVALVVVLLLMFRYSPHPIKKADPALADQIVQADTDLQTAINAAQTSYNTAIGANDATPSASPTSTATLPAPAASTDSPASGTVTLPGSDASVVALAATLQQAQALHDTATLLLDKRVTSLEAQPSAVYADSTYSTSFESSGQLPTSGFSLATVVSLHVTSAQVTAWLPNLATATTTLDTQTQAVNQALAEARANGGLSGLEAAISDLQDAIATAQIRLDLTKGEVDDMAVWNQLKATIAQAQTVLDTATSMTPGNSTPEQVSATTRSVTDAITSLNEQSRLVMESNQSWQSTHPGEIPPPYIPKPSTTTPTPSVTPTTTTTTTAPPTTQPPTTQPPTTQPPTTQPPTTQPPTTQPTETEQSTTTTLLLRRPGDLGLWLSCLLHRQPAGQC